MHIWRIDPPPWEEYRSGERSPRIGDVGLWEGAQLEMKAFLTLFNLRDFAVEVGAVLPAV